MRFGENDRGENFLYVLNCGNVEGIRDDATPQSPLQSIRASKKQITKKVVVVYGRRELFIAAHHKPSSPDFLPIGGGCVVALHVPWFDEREKH